MFATEDPGVDCAIDGADVYIDLTEYGVNELGLVTLTAHDMAGHQLVQVALDGQRLRALTDALHRALGDPRVVEDYDATDEDVVAR